jgi:hypothetical protein
MIKVHDTPKSLLGTAAAALVFGSGAPVATADAPCGDLDECRVIIEINATDGDIGFHVLFDAEGWDEALMMAPNGDQIFKERASAALRAQGLTENFFESTEPVCEKKLREDKDDEVVTLPEFLERFPAGVYKFLINEGELEGETELTHKIPAAPADVDFDGKKISWKYGDDLGECKTFPRDFALAEESDIIAYEVVLEPEDETLSPFTFTVRVPSNVNSVTVPAEHLAGLPANTPLKVEVGAIERRPNGSFGNQTFSEEDGFCNNANQEMCPEAGD